MDERPEKPNESRFRLIRWLDCGIVALINVCIVLARFRSRDPRRGWQRSIKADENEERRVVQWKAVLDWPQHQRVGCSLGILIGILIGITFLWYQLRN